MDGQPIQMSRKGWGRHLFCIGIEGDNDDDNDDEDDEDNDCKHC